MFALMMLILYATTPMDIPPQPIIGEYEFTKGWIQTTTFHPDGTCVSPKFGNGHWHREGNMLYLTEKDDSMYYILIFNSWKTLSGVIYYENYTCSLDFQIKKVTK